MALDMNISRYDFREQIEGVRKAQPKDTLFRRIFFNGPEFYSATEKVEWDEIRDGNNQMAKYIHPRSRTGSDRSAD